MAAGDLALRILVTAETGNALGLMSGLGGVVGGIFKKMAFDAGTLKLGLTNMGNAGVKSTLAIRDGAAGLAVGLTALIAIVALVAAAVAIGIGIMAVKAAADFQQGMNRLVTGAGDVTDNMQKMGQSILKVSMDTGVTSKALIDAMYQILSTGQRGSQALDTLAASARGAQIEQANVVDVTKALTTAMTDYGTKQYNATQYMNGYIVAVQRGKITLQELSTAMGPILPLAKSIGISFADVAAAMSTMTNAGIPATRAATSLRFMMQAIENPTTKASKAMVHFGLDSIKVADEMKKSLPGALQMVYDAAKKAGPEGSVPFNRAVSDMIGGSRSLQSFLALTGGHMKDFKNNTQGITDAMKKSKDAVLGWDVAQKGFNIQMDKGKASIQALLINIGTQLLPVLTKIVQNVVPVIQRFADWVIQNHIVEKALAALGIVFGVVGNVMSFIIPIVGFLWAQFMQLVNWVQHNQSVMDALKMVLMILGGIIAAILIVALIAAIVVFVAVGAAIAILVGIVWGIIWVVTHFGEICKTVWDFIRHTFEYGVLMAMQALRPMFEMLAQIPGPVGDMARNILKTFDHLAAGITNDLNDTKNKAIQHTAQMTNGVLQHMADMDNKASDHSKHMHDQIVQQIKNTKDEALKHTLELKLKAVDHMQQMQTLSGNHAEIMKHRVTTSAQQMSNTLVGNSIIPDMCLSVIHNFATMIPGIMGAVGSLPGRMAGFFSNLASQAVSWGANIISGLINGIASMAGGVASAIGNIAGIVASHLPHSPVKEGPLVGLEHWGGTIVDMLASGMIAGTPGMRTAVRGLASGIASELQVGGGFSLSGTSSGSNAFALGGGSSGGQGTMNMTILLDGREITKVVGMQTAREMRIQGTVRNR